MKKNEIAWWLVMLILITSIVYALKHQNDIMERSRLEIERDKEHSRELDRKEAEFTARSRPAPEPVVIYREHNKRTQERCNRFYATSTTHITKSCDD